MAGVFNTVTKPSVPVPEKSIDALYESVMALKQIVEGFSATQGEPGIQGEQGDPGPAGPGVNLAKPTYDEYTLKTNFVGTYPQDAVCTITGGNRIFRRTFTALDAAHRIRVKFLGFFVSGAGQIIQNCLFIDDATNAIRVQPGVAPMADNASTLGVLHWEGVLSAGVHTFEIRVGCLAGMWTNFWSGTQDACTLTIEELNAP